MRPMQVVLVLVLANWLIVKWVKWPRTRLFHRSLLMLWWDPFPHSVLVCVLCTIHTVIRCSCVHKVCAISAMCICPFCSDSAWHVLGPTGGRTDKPVCIQVDGGGYFPGSDSTQSGEHWCEKLSGGNHVHDRGGPALETSWASSLYPPYSYHYTQIHRRTWICHAVGELSTWRYFLNNYYPFPVFSVCFVLYTKHVCSHFILATVPNVLIVFLHMYTLDFFSLNISRFSCNMM